jgi:hypothetical protein
MTHERAEAPHAGMSSSARCCGCPSLGAVSSRTPRCLLPLGVLRILATGQPLALRRASWTERKLSLTSTSTLARVAPKRVADVRTSEPVQLPASPEGSAGTSQHAAPSVWLYRLRAHTRRSVPTCRLRRIGHDPKAAASPDLIGDHSKRSAANGNRAPHQPRGASGWPSQRAANAGSRAAPFWSGTSRQPKPPRMPPEGVDQALGRTH